MKRLKYHSRHNVSFSSAARLRHVDEQCCLWALGVLETQEAARGLKQANTLLKGQDDE
jgi:hypothetical protein